MPRWIRVAIYLLLGTAIISGIIYAIDIFVPEIRLGAGIYLALTAANSIIALHCEKLAVKTDLRHAFLTPWQPRSAMRRSLFPSALCAR